MTPDHTVSWLAELRIRELTADAARTRRDEGAASRHGGRSRRADIVPIGVAVVLALVAALAFAAAARAAVAPSPPPCAAAGGWRAPGSGGEPGGVAPPLHRDLEGAGPASGPGCGRPPGGHRPLPVPAAAGEAAGVLGGKATAAPPGIPRPAWSPLGAARSSDAAGVRVLALGRLAVPPGASLALAGRIGPTVIAVDAGALTIAVEEGTVRVVGEAGGPVDRLGPGATAEVGPGDSLVPDPGAAFLLRNGGEGAAVAVVATLAPPPLPSEPPRR